MFTPSKTPDNIFIRYRMPTIFHAYLYTTNTIYWATYKNINDDYIITPFMSRFNRFEVPNTGQCAFQRE